MSLSRGDARRSVFCWLTLLLAAVCIDEATPAVALPATSLPPGLTLSVQDDHLAVTPESNIGARVGLVASTGVRLTRVDVLWNTVAPGRPGSASNPNDAAYRWSRYDAVVDGFTRRGIAVILNVYRSPSWANGNRSYQWAPAESHFAAFMTALARRYDGRTRDRAGRVHGPVEMFEPWNEPNLPGFLMPQWQTAADGTATPASPRIYAGLLARAYASVKAVQPGAWVIGVSGGPNGSNNPPNGSVGIVPFIRGLVQYRPPADAFAQHLYPGLGPQVSVAMPSYNRLPELIGELDAVRPGLPILITEFGWTTMPTSVRSSFVSPEAQEAYLRQALDMLAAIPRVRLAVWFNLDDNAEWTSGLRRADSSIKPSWTTFVGLGKFRAPAPPPPAQIPPVQVPTPDSAAAPGIAAATVNSALPVAKTLRDARCPRVARLVRKTTADMLAAQRVSRKAVTEARRTAATKRLRQLSAQRKRYQIAFGTICTR